MITAKPGRLQRVLYAIPFLGTIARDISESVDNVYYALVILLTALVIGVQIWGLVALTMAALVAVPIMFVLLIRITLG